MSREIIRRFNAEMIEACLDGYGISAAVSANGTIVVTNKRGQYIGASRTVSGAVDCAYDYMLDVVSSESALSYNY